MRVSRNSTPTRGWVIQTRTSSGHTRTRRTDCACRAPIAWGELLDQVRSPGGLDRGLAGRKEKEHGDEHELDEEQLDRDRGHWPAFLRRSAFLMARAGIPTATIPSGTSLVTTAPAPVVAPAPTVTGARSNVSEPMKASSPTMVRFLRTPS